MRIARLGYEYSLILVVTLRGVVVSLLLLHPRGVWSSSLILFQIWTSIHPELTYSPDLTSWLHTHPTLLIYPDLLTILTYYLSWLVSDLFSLLIPLITFFFFKLIPPTAQINTTHHTFIYYPDLFLTDLFILLTYSYSWLANPPDLFLKYAFILLPYFWLIPMLAHTQHTTTYHTLFLFLWLVPAWLEVSLGLIISLAIAPAGVSET